MQLVTIGYNNFPIIKVTESRIFFNPNLRLKIKIGYKHLIFLLTELGRSVYILDYKHDNLFLNKEFLGWRFG